MRETAIFRSILDAAVGLFAGMIPAKLLPGRLASACSAARAGRMLICAALLAGSAPAAVQGQEATIPPAHHAWGHFAPGAWARVRILSETTSEDGSKIISTTTRTTTLKAVDENGVTLQVETTVEVAGSPVVSAPQTLQFSFDDLPAAEAGQVARTVLGPGSVEIEGVPERCTIHQIEIADTATKTVIKRFYSPDVTPHVLRCETTKVDRTTEAVLAETIVQVTARDIPYPLGGKIHATALAQETHKHPSGAIRRLSLHAAEIPGGVLGESTRELDSNGRVIRRSTLEMLEFEAK